MKLIELFAEGGYIGMSVITIILVSVFFAAWKAPGWVINLGKIAAVAGIIWMIAGISQMASVLGETPGISAGIIWKGMKVTLIPAMYGLAVYIVALIIDTIQKPKL